MPLDSYQFTPVPKGTRFRSDSPINLYQKKATKLYENVIAGEYNLEQSRLLKLQSEMIPHILDHGYYMTGKAMTLKDCCAVPEKELLRLRRLNLTNNAALYYGKGIR